jgi:glutaredoxin
MNAQVLGISVDHVPCLKAWADSLGGISYPLLSDFWPHGAVAKEYSVLREKEGHSERAIFIVDGAGIVRYIDIHDIDEQPDNEVLFRELRRIDPDVAASTPERIPVELPQGGIVMYCTPWCADCARAATWLRRKGHTFREVNIYDTPGAAEQVRVWTGGHVVTPVFDVDGTIVVDFDEARLAELLK